MIQWEPAFFPRVKRPERDVNHWPPSNAEVKNDWSYTSIPLYAFMVWIRKTSPFYVSITEDDVLGRMMLFCVWKYLTYF